MIRLLPIFLSHIYDRNTKIRNKGVMKNFNFYAPTEVVFGDQSEEQVAQLVQP